MELAGLVRYYIQIKGNFDLTVIITGVGIPTTLREIDWPKASFAKASFSQFWSTIPSQACQLLEIRTWVHETWGKKKNERYTYSKELSRWSEVVDRKKSLLSYLARISHDQRDKDHFHHLVKEIGEPLDLFLLPGFCKHYFLFFDCEIILLLIFFFF